MAALTNDPGITGMKRLAVLSAITEQLENTKMPELLRKLLAKLGVEVTDGAELTEEQAQTALSSLEALQAGKTEAEDKVAALSAAQKEVDLSAYVPKATYDAVVNQVAVLSAQNTEAEIESLVGKARNDGRAVEAEVDYLKQFGKQQGVAALSAMLEARPKIAVLSAQQTSTTKVDTEKGTAVLSAADKEAAKLLGMSEADYMAHVKTMGE